MCRWRSVRSVKVKGLYRLDEVGELKGLAGKDDIYEAPLAPDVQCADQTWNPVGGSANKVLAALYFHAGETRLREEES